VAVFFFSTYLCSDPRDNIVREWLQLKRRQILFAEKEKFDCSSSSVASSSRASPVSPMSALAEETGFSVRSQTSLSNPIGINGIQ
jgi:hypothetical protein